MSLLGRASLLTLPNVPISASGSRWSTWVGLPQSCKGLCCWMAFECDPSSDGSGVALLQTTFGEAGYHDLCVLSLTAAPRTFAFALRQTPGPWVAQVIDGQNWETGEAVPTDIDGVVPHVLFGTAVRTKVIVSGGTFVSASLLTTCMPF